MTQRAISAEDTLELNWKEALSKNPGKRVKRTRAMRKLSSEKEALDGKLHTYVFLAPALVVTAFVYMVWTMAGPDTWLKDFIVHRSVVQWITLYLFVLGLVLLGKRVPVYIRERHALANLKYGCPDKNKSSVVNRRFRRVYKHLKRHGSEDVRQHAQHLASADMDELDAGYSISGDLINVLPLIGFFGTVLGLSVGLYKRFVQEGGADSSESFIKAIGTAFDTTLLSLGCTILVIILQRLFFKREQALIMDLNRVIDRFLYKKIPAEMISDEKGTHQDWTETITERTAKGMEQMTGRITESFGKALEASAVQAADTAQNKISQATDHAVQSLHQKLAEVAEGVLKHMSQKTELFTKEMLDKISPSFAGALASAVEAVEKQNGKASRVVAEAITSNFSLLGNHIEAIVKKPRRTILIEEACMEEEVSNA